jgi:hypothetical protein
MDWTERNTKAVEHTIADFRARLQSALAAVAALQNAVASMALEVAEMRNTINLMRAERGTGPSVKG